MCECVPSILAFVCIQLTVVLKLPLKEKMEDVKRSKACGIPSRMGVSMASPLKGKLETILVVDDNEVVLRTVVLILEHDNFRVLSAANGADAVQLAEESTEKIDLLLSDVDMPKMSGPDLGEKLKKIRPNIHVMLMSGGADGNLLVLNYGWAFIQKPFVAVKLVSMINAATTLHSCVICGRESRWIDPYPAVPRRWLGGGRSEINVFR
jgi:CheY-like chemotaxis protein